MGYLAEIPGEAPAVVVEDVAGILTADHAGWRPSMFTHNVIWPAGCI